MVDVRDTALAPSFLLAMFSDANVWAPSRSDAASMLSTSSLSGLVWRPERGAKHGEAAPTEQCLQCIARGEDLAEPTSADHRFLRPDVEKTTTQRSRQLRRQHRSSLLPRRS